MTEPESVVLPSRPPSAKSTRSARLPPVPEPSVDDEPVASSLDAAQAQDDELVVPTLTALARIANALESTIADVVLVGESPREELFAATLGLSAREIAPLLQAARRQTKAIVHR